MIAAKQKVQSLVHVRAYSSHVSWVPMDQGAHQGPLSSGDFPDRLLSRLSFLPKRIFLTQGLNPHLLRLAGGLFNAGHLEAPTQQMVLTPQ